MVILNLQYLSVGFNPFVMPLNGKWLNNLELIHLTIKNCNVNKIPQELKNQKGEVNSY